VETDTGMFEVLTADRKAGHASSFDLVVCDETGLFKESARELLAGLRSSISAKGGRILHISVRGDSGLYHEILENPATCAKVFAAPDGCELSDKKAWRAANPGLGTIKSLEYMRSEVERIKAVPSDEASFRAYDLNQQLDPQSEMICSPDDLRACFTNSAPELSHNVFLGFDFGESSSGTAAVAIDPVSGWVRTWLAFGESPSLIARGKRDNADYIAMRERGELHTYPGRITPLAKFLRRVANDLDGRAVIAAAADGYKASECLDAIERSGLDWPIEFRRFGAGRDGGADVRRFQRLVATRRIAMLPNLSLADAVAKSELRRDANGNPGLNRAKTRGRIDVLSAAVIACGLAEPHIGRKYQPAQWITI